MNNKLTDREKQLKEKWDKCDHVWTESDFVIDTLPPIYSYYCIKKCGATKHKNENGYCYIKHYA